MNFRATAIGQRVAGTIEVLGEIVRIELHLPRALAWLGRRIGGRIRQQADLLLEKR
jgi:hypothetical protein